MVYILFFFVVLGLAYAIFMKPGIALAYILFGQNLNSLLFERINLHEYRYALSAVVLIGVFLLHFRKRAFEANIVNLVKNRLAQAYVILSVYVIAYGMLIGSTYEMEYIDEFVVPGVALFLVGSLMVFDRKMYDGLVVGIVVWLTLSFVQVFFFGSDEAIMSGERGNLLSETGMSAIAQGRMGGALGLIAMLMIWHKRNPAIVVISLCILLLGVTWMGWIGTRGALFAFLCATAVYLYFTPTNFSIKVILGVFGAAILYFGISETLVLERTKSLWEPGTIEEMSRIDRIFIFLELIPKYFIFGMGPGGWGKQVQIGDYPHNMFIELFIELGLTGLLVFFMIMIGGFKQMKVMVDTPGVGLSAKILGVLWVFYAAAVMFSGDLLRNAEIFSMSGIVAGMSVHFGQRARVPATVVYPNLPRIQ